MLIENIKEKNLKDLNLDKDIYNTEAKMYKFSSCSKNIQTEKILKKLYIDNGMYFGNKLNTINTLIDHSEEIQSFVPEIILPEKVAIIKNKMVGFTMPYIESIGLNQALKEYNFTTEEKIAYLKKIGEILEKIKLLNSYSSIHNLSLNDLHEDNFIIEKNTGNLRVVDLDSCKILDNNPSSGKILTEKTKVLSLAPNKYISTTDDFGKQYLPSYETDIFCYYMIILNFLYSKRDVYKMENYEYYEYLDYLKKIGISDEFYQNACSIITQKGNINPYELLDTIRDVYPKSIKAVYNVSKKQV